jgi:hypothetical protein
MQIESLSYRPGSAWDRPLPASLDSPETLVLAFGARQYADEDQPLRELVAAFPQSAVIGCSTSGEIGGCQVDDDTVSLAVCRFEHTRLVTAITRISGADDSGAAGTRLAAQLPAQGLRAVFVLSDGMAVNGTPLVEALARGLPVGVQISGGLAGDGSRFNSTWVLAGGTAQPRQVCAVGFYGDRLRVGGGHDGGWSDFGPLRHITRSQGNVLYELDGRPALDLYKEYLGKMAEGLPGTALLFPLSIRCPTGSSEPLVRTILGIDERKRSMTFAGDVPEGHEARLMRTTNEGLVNSAGNAIAKATRGLLPTKPSLVISVSCVGRRLVLGERTEEEVELLMEGAPADAAHVGFYSYGEIAHSGDGGVSRLHNQTVTVTVLTED